MKSLPELKHDNRLTSRDFGGLCNWFVFRNGDFLAAFVLKYHAKEFASMMEYEGGGKITITKAKD